MTESALSSVDFVFALYVPFLPKPLSGPDRVRRVRAVVVTGMPAWPRQSRTRRRYRVSSILFFHLSIKPLTGVANPARLATSFKLGSQGSYHFERAAGWPNPLVTLFSLHAPWIPT